MTDRWDDRSYIPRLADAVSQFFNVALANGMPDETISGRTWRNTGLRWRAGQPAKWRWIVVYYIAEALFWPLDRGHHCRLAFEKDLERAVLRAQAVSGGAP